MGIPRVWGATADEVAREYPCDRFVDGGTAKWFRAVTVNAAPETVFRWLCQLKVGPYSYDLIDNPGRWSPRELTPGVDELAVGQRFMRIFELVDFEPDRQLTLRVDDRAAEWAFGKLAVTYAVHADAPGETRLVVKLAVSTAGGWIRALSRPPLAWGDLVMMRHQLHRLAALAEKTEKQAA